MSLVLEVLQSGVQRVDLSGLRFEALTGLTIDQVRALPIVVDGQLATLNDCFAISGSTETNACRIVGDCSVFDGVGTKLRNYRLAIDGSVGDRLGCQMRSGCIQVSGNAGNFLGGPSRGVRTGMRGGAIIVRGDAGQFCGYRMRRGTIVVGGSTGTGLAAEMVAGTIQVGIGQGFEQEKREEETDFSQLALGMRRGTVVLMGCKAVRTAENSAKFSSATPVDRVFRRLLADYLAELQNLASQQFGDWEGHAMLEPLRESGRAWQRVIGDRAVGGLGEIWFEGDATC